jgi:ligand-binding sensor domain-containing protein
MSLSRHSFIYVSGLVLVLASTLPISANASITAPGDNQRVGAFARESDSWGGLAPADNGSANMVDAAPAMQEVAPAQIAATINRFSLRLNDSNSYVRVDNDPTLLLADADGITLEAWVRPSSNTGDCQAIIGKGAYLNASGNGFGLAVCNRHVYFRTVANNGAEGSQVLPANAWSHIAVTWQRNGERNYYINGRRDFVGSAGSAPVNTNSALLIGATTSGGSACCVLQGNIAEVRIWRTARGQNEIRRSMHMALDEARPGLVAVWHLAGDAQDALGVHHGSLQGSAGFNNISPPPQPAVVPLDGAFNELPSGRALAAAIQIGESGRGLLIGGATGSSSLNGILAVDLATGGSQPLGALPGALAGAAAAYAPSNGLVYLFGGSSARDSGFSAAIHAIDPANGQVRMLAVMLPAPLSRAAAIYLPDAERIVVIGGLNDGGGLTSISLFDPATETIVATLPSLPAPLHSMAAAYSRLTRQVYLFGGVNGSSVVMTIHHFSVGENGEPGAVTPLPISLPEADFGLAAVEDPTSSLIYLVGGEQEHVFVFDPVSEELWRTHLRLDGTRSYPGAFFDALNRHILLLGGQAPLTDDVSPRPDARGVQRITVGNGPAIPTGRWSFPTALGSPVNAIHGDERYTLVGANNGAWRYAGDGSRVQITPATLGSASGVVNDVFVHTANDDLWFATDDNGARREDGGVYTTFAIPPSTYKQVNAFAIAPQYSDPLLAGMFATNQGLRWYNLIVILPGSGWRTDFAGQNVTAVAMRSRRDVWVVADRRLKRMTVNALGSVVTTADYGQPCSLFGYWTDMQFAPNGDFWLVSPPPSGDDDVNVPNPAICRHLAGTTPGAGNLLTPDLGNGGRDVSVDGDGRIWVAVASHFGQSGGLAAYENVGNGLRTSEFNWLSAPIAGLSLVNPGGTGVNNWDSGLTAVAGVGERVVVGRSDGLLAALTQRWQQFSESNGLGSLPIEGVWLGRGRAFLAGATTLHVLQPDGITWDNRSGVHARAVLADRAGRIWVGTDTDVRLYTADGWDLLAGVEGTRPIGPVMALAEDRDGRVWIGGAGGLTLFDRGRFVTTFTTANSGLPANEMRALLVDRDDVLWAGTSSGLARFDGASWATHTIANGLPDNAIHALAQPGDGAIAVSTANGLSLYTNGIYSPTTPPSGNANLPLAVDELGRLWAGGAVRTANGWQNYTPNNSGLRAVAVSAVAADGAGRVWFGHAPEGGVSVRGDYLPPLADSVPTLSGIAPAQGSAGDVLTISGGGFGNVRANVQVEIGGAQPEIISANDSAITVKLTAHNVSGDVSVRVNGRRATLANAFCAEPVISGYTPTGGNVGVYVEISGSNFDRDATVSLGGGPARFVNRRDPELIYRQIETGDGVGSLVVTNRCDHSATAAGEFRTIELTIQRVVLNQGIPSVGLAAEKPTLVQHYLSRNRQTRATDAIQIDQAVITFSANGNEQTVTLPYSAAAPTIEGAPTATMLRSIDRSVNVVAIPSISGDAVQVHTVLKRFGKIVAEGATTRAIRANRRLRVLFVPIMPDGYSFAQLAAMKQRVNEQFDHARRRIFPNGRVDASWSSIVYTVNDVGDGSGVNFDSLLDLYNGAHELHSARVKYNKESSNDVVIAFGVVHGDAVDPDSGIGGKAFMADVSQFANMIFLGWVDALCDIVVEVLTLGFGDGCELDIPLYVAWARADGGNISSLFAHEMGHTLGLVKPTASNGKLYDNFSHSINDEISGPTVISPQGHPVELYRSCKDVGEKNDLIFDWNKSLYRQSGVSEPLVDAIGATQHLPLDDSSMYNWNTDRGKAIMSYACTRRNANVFFEPTDVNRIFQEFAMFPIRDFIETITPLEAAAPAPPPTALSKPPIDGVRIFISGLLDRAVNTGSIDQVEVIGDTGPLDASYATGYWLVQLDASGAELMRVGVFPIFAGEDEAESNLGFYSATLLRQPGLARLELRHGETLLDSFSAGGAAPTVSVSSPTGGAFSAGSLPLAWTISDADGDLLAVTVLYSADSGATWTPMETLPPAPPGPGAANLPVAGLAGSANARIRVIASDGFQSGEATSAAFTVTAQPPLPYIGAPEAGASVLEGETLYLSGGADDLQDGALMGSALRWRSDREGNLGVGQELPVFLSVGQHTLTLEATNSAGLTASTSVTLTVTGDYDADGLSDLVESAGNLNPLNSFDAQSDADNDGLTLLEEIQRGTNPNNPDSDGDGRSDGDEVAAATSPTQADQPLPPDTLRASPPALTFTVDMALPTALPQEQVTLLSRESHDWQLVAGAEWLAASAVAGRTVEGTTLLVQTHELSDGVHQANVAFRSAELGNTVSVPVIVTVTNSAAFFDFDGNGVNVGDVQNVAGRTPTEREQPGFGLAQDLNRDGKIDGQDVQSMVGRWNTQRACCGDGHPLSGAALRVTTPSAVVAGQIFDVQIVLDNAQSVAGAEFDLHFDPLLLEVQSVVIGSLLSSSGRAPGALGPLIDNGAGMIAFGGYTQGDSPAASGNGVLAQMQFRAKTAGTSSLELQRHLLSNVQGGLSLAQVQNGAVTITGDAPPLQRVYLPMIAR